MKNDKPEQICIRIILFWINKCYSGLTKIHGKNNNYSKYPVSYGKY